MSPINTTSHHLLVAILGVLIISQFEGPLSLVGHILLAVGAIPGLWRMVKADWAWIKDHTEIKFWS